MRADLHIHTTASDGTWDPSQVVEAVCAAGIGVFAVSDHDSVANVEETKLLAAQAGLRFLPGVELNSTKDGHNYHILGYGIDSHNTALLELCRHNQRLLEQKDVDSVRNLIERGWPLSMEEFASYSYDPHRGGWKALAYLQDKGLCTDVNDFFRRIFTAENDLGFPDFPAIAEVVSVIHQSGGVAICAHLASDFHGAGMQEYLPGWWMKNWTDLNVITPVTVQRTAGCWLTSAVAINCTFPAEATATEALFRPGIWGFRK